MCVRGCPTLPDDAVINKIITILRHKPQYKDVLRNALKWHREHFKCDKCGNQQLVKVSDYLYRCPKCGYEKMIFGFEAHEVNAMPAYLYKLYNEGILKITYKSRRYTNYILADPESVEKALSLFEKSKEDMGYDKPIKIPDDLFQDIIGYDDIKKIIINALKSPKPVHILLWGVPSSGKSMIMEDLWKKIPGSHMILAGTSTKAGIRDIIAEYSPRLLLIDELDKINNSNDLSVLLSWMESQRIVIAMRDRYEVVECKYVDGCKVIAACNNIRPIPPELRSRFLIIRIKPYTEEQFLAIVKHVLVNREGKDLELAEYIGRKVLTELHSRDPRDAIKVARLANTKEEVDKIIKTLKIYR